MFYFTTDSALKIYPKGEKMTAVVFLRFNLYYGI